MAETKQEIGTPILEVGTLKVYAEKFYEVGRKLTAKAPSIAQEKLKSGVIYIRGGHQFTDATPTHTVTGRDVLKYFTLVKHRVFDTEPVVYEFDPNLTIREVNK